MKNARGLSGPKRRESLMVGLLLLSSIFIISTSAFVYANIIYRRTLNVDNPGGVTMAPGSADSTAVGLTPTTVMILATEVLVISFSAFVLLRRASKHISNVPAGPGLPVHLPSMQGEDWKKSSEKEAEG